MPSAPTIAAIRFGTGLRPRRAGPAPAPVDAAALLAELQAPDVLAARFPVLTRPEAEEMARQVRPARRACQAGTERGDPAPELAYRALRQRLRFATARGAQMVIARAVEAEIGFRERLVQFWSDHFATRPRNAEMGPMSQVFAEEAIRPHLAGSFPAMLKAAATHPMMLVYLDQNVSVGPNSRAGRKGGGLNENLAREILELHTLGVRTGYDQDDVTELARALTGWTVAGLGRGASARFAGTEGEPGSFVFAPRLHEPGSRTLLGRTFAQGGEGQAAAVLDFVATHPATARHIATKLARHFAGDEPPAPLVARLEASFLETGGDLPSLYRVLVEAPECWVEQPVKFKTPWEWSIGAMRALGTSELPPRAVTGLLTQLGQPVWRPGSPAGWDDVAASWAAPDAIMRRVEAAERMAGRTGDRIDARERAAKLFPGSLSESTAQAIARAESPGQAMALLLVAPESMRR
jgi:uncharacterized protein (DUF1800 family)